MSPHHSAKRTARFVLVINTGSSSLKVSLYDTENGIHVAQGLAESLNQSTGQLELNIQNDSYDESLPAPSHEAAIKRMLQCLNDHFDLQEQLLGVGHRVVHGGEMFSASTLITPDVRDEIQHCCALAPLHNPANLEGIEIVGDQLKDTPQVAVFDTAFHQTMPQSAYIYGLPYALYEEKHVRRYGFHGTSHRFVALQAAEYLGKDKNSINLITAHLGNGASVTAIRDGASVDTSMGMTPLEGLVMGTRSGDIDPGIYDFLLQHGYQQDQVSELLNKKSGLLGISGETNDMRTLIQKADQGHTRCQLAIDIFCFRLARYIMAMSASLHALDALVFTGGIGENAALVRQKTIAHLTLLGFSIDAQRNDFFKPEKTIPIQGDGSRTILVIPTDEEAMIAQDTAELIQARQSAATN